MKTSVLEIDVLELEIKPKELLDHYRQLIAQDVHDRFILPDTLVQYPCPGCQAETGAVVFERFGLKYIECDVCRTVYVTPRPSEEEIIDFYRNSKTALFWRDQILPKTSRARHVKLLRPQARWVLDAVDRYLPDAKFAIMLGYHNAPLVEELIRPGEDLFHIVVTNPVADIEFAGKEFPNVEIRPMPLNSLALLGSVDILLAFDILDRCADPDVLFATAQEILSPGGLVLASTTLISGFDHQVLWERSGSIYPPDRLNLLSVEGLTALFERHGFEAMEFSTPGRFDVEIVQRAIEERPGEDWPRFIRYLVEKRDHDALNAFQEYLQAYRLSSFARLILQKPK
jgi:SAM-dependent methyltransferase